MIRKVSRWLHMVLGLASSLIVIIVCLTGAIALFEDEIRLTLEPWRTAERQEAPLAHPQALREAAEQASGLNGAPAITIGPEGRASHADYWGAEGRLTVYMDPYSAQPTKIVKKGRGEFDFFSFVMDGHKHLWLPRETGRAVVSYGVLVFLIVLITGLILWVPRRWNWEMLKSRLTFKRPFRFKRLVFDLHNVLGFYALLPLIVASLTGFVFGLPWFARGVYSLVSGGEEMKAYTLPSSTLPRDSAETASADVLYEKILAESPDAKQIYMVFPRDSAASYRVSVVHEIGSYYKQDNLFFDQYTLEELEGTGPYAGRYHEGSTADKVIHMSLDIHEGRVFGFIGKMIMLLACIVGVSLPITGFILWYRRR